MKYLKRTAITIAILTVSFFAMGVGFAISANMHWTAPTVAYPLMFLTLCSGTVGMLTAMHLADQITD